jgi:vitamin B12 transporter
LRYFFPAGQSLAAALGTGFKPPSFFALGHPLVGNRSLRPEESTTAEVSLSSSEEARTRQRVSLFRSQFRDLIDFDAGPPPRLVNRSHVNVNGIEYSVTTRIAPGTTLGAGVTSLSFDLPEGEGPLRNRPKQKLTGTLTSALTDSVSLRVLASRVGRVFDSSVPTGGQYLDPYVVVDSALHYAMGTTEASIALDNVFDRGYQQFIGFPAPGRRLRVQVSLGI